MDGKNRGQSGTTMKMTKWLLVGKIDGSWYYFQTSGAMRTGWLKDGSKWYYLKSSGEMQTGWLKDKGIGITSKAQVL